MAREAVQSALNCCGWRNRTRLLLERAGRGNPESVVRKTA